MICTILLFSTSSYAQSAEEVDLPNGRQILPYGYYISGMISPQDVATLVQLGVDVVISLEEPYQRVLDTLEANDIEHLSLPINSNFRDGELLLERLQDGEPEVILIHCEEGRNRSGVVLAFLLVAVHQWSIPDAFYAVVNPSTTDIENLEEILGYPPNLETTSIYAGEDGGMVVRYGGFQGVGYYNLVNSTIQEIMDN